MGPTTNLNYLIHQVATDISKQSDQILLEQLGIGVSQFRILLALDWNPNAQQRTIAESLGQTEASVSRQLKLLEAKGLTSTSRHPQDQRQHVVVLTAKGSQTVEAADGILQVHFGPRLNRLGEDKILQLADGLQKLQRAIGH